MAKERKTSAELATLVTSEIRKYPECDEINSVSIIRLVGMNWDVAVVRNGPYVTPASFSRVEHIVQQLRQQFDLVKRLATAEQLVDFLVTETTREFGRDASFLRGQITLRRRPPTDGVNWDANCGIALPAAVAAFGHALKSAQDSYDLANESEGD